MTRFCSSNAFIVAGINGYYSLMPDNNVSYYYESLIQKGVKMKNLILGSLILALSQLQFSCTSPEPFNKEQVLQAIQEEIAIYSTALRERDLNTILGTYMDDAVVLPPDGDMLRGKEAIGQMYESLWEIGLQEVILTTIEIGGSGDLAYEIGRTRVQIQPEGMEVITDSTKYLVIWKKQPDGKWKVYADMFSFSVPGHGN
jgi:uncharacterized protein (TIGR02246 family)